MAVGAEEDVWAALVVTGGGDDERGKADGAGEAVTGAAVPIRLDGRAGDFEETARTEVADNLIMHTSGAPYLVAILAIKQVFEWE